MEEVLTARAGLVDYILAHHDMADSTKVVAIVNTAAKTSRTRITIIYATAG
jgi:hypothetical protein